MLATQVNIMAGLMEAVSKSATAEKPLASQGDAIMDASKLAIYAFSQLSQCRRENVICEYGKPLQKLCLRKEKVGATLLIDAKDICKKLKIKRLYKKSRFQGKAGGSYRNR
jgi:hypothetical protein